jgi:hypothetical protein
MRMRIAVWIGITLIAIGCWYLYIRGLRCDQCNREFAIFRRRFRRSELRLCRRHVHEWDKLRNGD